MKKGALQSPVDVRDYKYTGIAKAAQYPSSFILEIGNVKNQQEVNSCVAHVAAEIEEYFNLKEGRGMLPLSPGYVYGHRYKYTGEGMYLRDALKTLKNYGVCELWEFPYNVEVPECIKLVNSTKRWTTDYYNKITTYFSINTKGEDRNHLMKDTLMRSGPIMASIKWYDGIEVVDGVIDNPMTGDAENHCIMIYGWNEKGWLIRNSWGKEWGDNGNATYPYEYPIEEAWGVTDNLSMNDFIKKPRTGEFRQFIYKVVNKLIRWLQKFAKSEKA